MSKDVEVFWGGEPEQESERQFLAKLKADLQARGIRATILANFYTKRSSRQIDFFVITPSHACHVELKNYSGTLIGPTNGPWSTLQPDGSLRTIDQPNPYHQTVTARFSISDDMGDFAAAGATAPTPAGDKAFYTQFDSIICVFPRLAAGSQVPNDYKAKTLGYSDFLALLVAPGPRPTWSPAHWSAFIMSLGLVRIDTPTGGITADTARRLVSEYISRLRDFHGRRLHELVTVTLNMGETTIHSEQLVDRLAQSRSIQLVGPSGSGKSHLVKHLMLAAISQGSLPILVSAGMYDGRLSPLLNRSVAPFATHTASELLNAAALAGNGTVVIIDGYNECPAQLQERLLQDINAFFLRVPAVLLLTSQAALILPETIDGQIVQVESLSGDERQAVLASYGAPDILNQCDAFSTAYELSIAAECASELLPPITRANLFDAFVRSRLADTTSPSLTRDALRRIALIMDERLVTSLSADEVWRVTEQALVDRADPLSVIDDVLNCPITATRQGKFSFSHELIGRFLTAEALTLTHRDPSELAQELMRPRHRDLQELSVPLETDPLKLRLLLTSLADSELLTESLRGRLGTVAQRVVAAEARGLLGRATETMKHVRIVVKSEHEFELSESIEWSTYEGSLFAAAGSVTPQGQLIHEVADFLATIDAACRPDADTPKEVRPTPSAIVSAVYVGFIRPAGQSSASVILQACEHGRYSWRFRQANESEEPIPTDSLARLVERAIPQNYGILYLLCLLLRYTHSSETARLVPEVMRMSWRSGAYHLRLQALQMVQYVSQVVDSPTRAELTDLLEAVRTSNVFLSTALVEALDSYGLIESPVSAEQVSLQIRELLDGPPSEEANQAANGIVVNQFEEIFSEAHSAAIEALSPKERVALLTMASLGSTSGMFDDWVLNQLIAANDRAALPAFTHWATRLDADTPFVQEVPTRYTLAMQGSALFYDRPPRLSHCETKDEIAWQCYGEIIFWLYRPKLTPAEVRERCAPVWARLSGDLLVAAADPLFQFSHAWTVAPDGGKNAHQLILMTFPEEVRRILELSLLRRDQLTSLFRFTRETELTTYIINILGYVGAVETVDLLVPYLDDRELGSTTTSSVRNINKRKQ